MRAGVVLTLLRRAGNLFLRAWDTQAIMRAQGVAWLRDQRSKALTAHDQPVVTCEAGDTPDRGGSGQ